MASMEETFIEQWRTAAESNDHAGVKALLADEVTLYSPAVFKPAADRAYVEHILEFVAESIEGFHYIETYTQPGGAAMIFRGTIQDKTIEGVDFFKLDASGRVTELKVMLRPLNAAGMLAQSIMQKFAALNAS